MTRKYRKRCYYCGKIVYPGTGVYYYNHLAHIWCVNLRKARKALWKR